VEAVTMLYVFGAYTFDTQLYELRRAGELIPLGPQVFNVLAYLVQHRQRMVPKQELFECLWPGQFVGDDALERCIQVARRALGTLYARTAQHEQAREELSTAIELYRAMAMTFCPPQAEAALAQVKGQIG
jgi:DNA-binding response OmpR family regulator